MRKENCLPGSPAWEGIVSSISLEDFGERVDVVIAMSPREMEGHVLVCVPFLPAVLFLAGALLVFVFLQLLAFFHTFFLVALQPKCSVNQPEIDPIAKIRAKILARSPISLSSPEDQPQHVP